MLVLKHLKSWSYEQLEWEVTGNLVYRHFCRIDGGKVPDAKTMVRLGQLLEGDALGGLFDRVVQLAAKRRVTRGRKMRVDTTVVETPIRYPSDSRLCEDVTHVLCREVERVRSQGVTAARSFRNVRRSVGRRQREITQISRRPISRDAKRAALRKPYRRLLATTRRVLRPAVQTVKRARRRWHTEPLDYVSWNDRVVATRIGCAWTIGSVTHNFGSPPPSDPFRQGGQDPRKVAVRIFLGEGR